MSGVAPFSFFTADEMYTIERMAPKEMEKLTREQQEEINDAVS